jgi:hypothetical protein
MRSASCMVLLLAAACASRSQAVAPDPSPTNAPVLSYEEQIARDLEQIMAQDLGPAPATTPSFPTQLDDAALAEMIEFRRGFAFSAFFSEREWSMQWSDLMEHQLPPQMHHEATPLGRLWREVDAHHLRWLSHTPESAATLLALIHAAEAAMLYDWEIASHVWTHARELQPAPVAVFERLDHHFRVIRALHLGAAVTGPVRRDAQTGTIEVPPGLTAAAARAFPDTDAGSFDSVGTLALTVVRGRAVLLHRGVEKLVSEGEGLLLRRLDVLRVPAAATLGHAVLGEIAVAAGTEITAGNASGLLSPGQRDQVARLVATMRGPHSEAWATVEAMLPFAYPRIRANYINNPGDLSRLGALPLMYKFDGE